MTVTRDPRCDWWTNRDTRLLHPRDVALAAAAALGCLSSVLAESDTYSPGLQLWLLAGLEHQLRHVVFPDQPCPGIYTPPIAEATITVGTGQGPVSRDLLI